jgi:hypothetical protein
LHRHIVYPGSIPLDTDLLNAVKDAYYGVGWLAQSLIGVSTAVVGLAVTPTAPPSLQVNVAPGAIYSLQTVDASSYGSLGTDSNQFVKQGIAASSSTLTLTPPSTTGQSINYLVQVAFSEVDATPVLLPYYNADNPSIAWSGPNNSGTQQNTVRKDTCVIGLKAGSPAATGSQTTPAPDAGYTGIYVITVANGQTTITSGNIALVSTAPFFTPLPSVPPISQSGVWNFGTASGSANALTVALSPAPSALTTGMRIWLAIPSANTSPTVTLNVNGLGAVGVVRRNLAILAIGDIQPGLSEFIYDGTYWRLANPAYSATTRQRSGFNGLIGTAAGGSKTASWTIGQIGAGNGILSYSGNSVSIGFNGGGTGAGGMDTGATPVSGDLSIYAIYNPGADTWATLGTLGSTSNGLFYTGSNAPAGYSVSCLIWSGVTDSSGNLPAMRQVDRRIYLNAAGSVVVTGLSASSFAALSGLGAFVPNSATQWYARGIQTSNGNPSNIYLSPVAADAPGTMTTWSGVNNSAGDTLAIPLVAQKTAYYRVTAGQTWSVSSQGYDI